MKSSNDFFLNPGLALINFRTTWNLIMTEVALVDISNARQCVSYRRINPPPTNFEQSKPVFGQFSSSTWDSDSADHFYQFISP